MNSKPFKILILEDDFDTMKVIDILLGDLKQKLGWSVLISVEKSILDLIKTEEFNQIIVDIMIHSNTDDKENIHYSGITWKKTGIEFIRRLRAGDYLGENGKGTPRNVPIIVLSAITDSASEELKDLEGISYCEKPFRTDVLLDMILINTGR